MDKPDNHFADVAPTEAPAPKPSPPRFAGVGARIQGRPGVSLERMADRVHPVRK